jgi:hypothetical protein
MNRENTFQILGILAVLILIINPVQAGNIDPYNNDSKYAYGENVGWFNFDHSQEPKVLVYDGKLTGYIWQENIGWINLAPADPNYGGVTYDSNRHLSGYAWGENVGWINFNPTIPGDSNDYGVSIDSNGNFGGWAWGENIGWIHFSSTVPVDYGVSVCVVGFDDLRNFAEQWLMDGRGLAADLNNSLHVDFVDYSIFALDWSDFCPDNWRLK